MLMRITRFRIFMLLLNPFLYFYFELVDDLEDLKYNIRKSKKRINDLSDVSCHSRDLLESVTGTLEIFENKISVLDHKLNRV